MNATLITARAPERALEEILDEFYAGYFNGQPHQSPLGDVTFAQCDRLFNQADAPTPQRLPQIHTVFTGWSATEQWFAGGDLATWTDTLGIGTSWSGVRYGATTDGQVEESVHGKSVRRLTGSNIRWQTSGPDLVEQVYQGSTWVTIRTITGASALRWTRSGSDGISGDYLEQANISGTWTTQRTITPTDSVWDGTKALITAAVELTHFLRAPLVGDDLNKSDFLARSVASNLDTLLRDPEATAPLAQRGLRWLQHITGPRPLPTQGYATRVLTYRARLEYFIPREGQ